MLSLSSQAANITSAAEAAPFVFSVPNPSALLYGQGHSITFAASRIVSVEGDERLEYEYSKGADFSYSPAILELQLDAIIADRVAANDSLAVDQMNAWRNDTEVQFLYNQLCFAPASYNVRVVRAVRTYGIVSFLSDVGGFLNLLTIVLLFFFPFAHKLVEPRSFLGVWLGERWKQRKARAAAWELEQAVAAGTIAGASTSTQQQQPQKQQPLSLLQHSSPSHVGDAEMMPRPSTQL